ncbi:Rieske 2Fe-2S domain-containing protein [Duganella sp. FT80W]|uniref:Rieske 2Fe-2S domain-containing protein n=1 Tax=Duganella guangzhouensis TaxID=2666084 RepID=A0A6I2KSC0_9BURK|nr:aromatic ring-hydroxylating dioxygenase subunit alpha [Duganella guangzhouensis]MRW88533.1 Rieske 2Fe-2S domain-containing protein [Duganella guangzhouensis]
MTEIADYKQAFIRNNWYAAAWRREIDTRPLARTILGERLALFPTKEGGIGALKDQCPHRLAPLSMGECIDGGLRCGYHGLLFNASGACINVPGQDFIPTTAKVKSYPVRERLGLVWVWMGDAEPDESRLPSIPQHGEPGWALLQDGYQHHAANYRIEIENLMDPAHTTYLHKQTIGNPAAKDVPVQVERNERSISAFRWMERTPPSPFDKQSRDFGDGLVDRMVSFSFELPGVSFVEVCSMPTGLDKTEDNKNLGLRTLSYKFLTPEDERHTHFFWLHLRNHRLDDTAYEQQLRAGLEKTYVEDNQVASAIQIEQERCGKRQFTGLKIDHAPTMALRLLDTMIADEQATAVA